MKPGPTTVRLLWSATVLLAAIGVAAVVHRMFLLRSPGMDFDAGFARHPALTLFHIVPGLIFMVLGPLQFVRGLRSRRPALHRWAGRAVAASALVIGITALIMGPQMAIGGVNEASATTLFALVFLFGLAKGWIAIRRGKTAEHREWMIRAFAIGLAVAGIRPIVGLFFATSRLTHWSPRDFFGAAFWIGFTLHLMAAEVWIGHTRRLAAAAGTE
ncbi:MAG TPA: DUF2306 domain-containing protein [Bryobacteraceae bacterium]|jgi:uncharacterized membrane protein|nr:DUF2306 domain-containing protein [Bryobacteraceae bacterium]